MPLAHARERLLAVVGAIDPEALVGERRARPLAERVLVLDHQRARALRHRGQRLRRHRVRHAHVRAADRQLEQERRAASRRDARPSSRPPCSCAIA